MQTLNFWGRTGHLKRFLKGPHISYFSKANSQAFPILKLFIEEPMAAGYITKRISVEFFLTGLNPPGALKTSALF